jgi:competence protein ComEA
VEERRKPLRSAGDEIIRRYSEPTMTKFSRFSTSLLALTIAAPVFAAEPAVNPVPQTPSAATAPAKPASATQAIAPKAATVDINIATASDLKGLPGVSDADAAKIMQGRPYKDPSELVSKKIVNDAEFAKIKDHVVVGHPKS